MNEYTKQVEDFCKKFNVEMKIEYLKTDFHFEGDKEKRDIYNVTIKRNGKEYTFKFSDSIVNTEKNQHKVKSIATGKMSSTGQRKQVVTPSKYDVLACVQKYDIGDFDDFISDFGYEFNTEREYIKVKKLYFDVKDEYTNIHRLFSDCMDELAEIC